MADEKSTTAGTGARGKPATKGAAAKSAEKKAAGTSAKRAPAKDTAKPVARSKAAPSAKPAQKPAARGAAAKAADKPKLVKAKPAAKPAAGPTAAKTAKTPARAKPAAKAAKPAAKAAKPAAKPAAGPTAAKAAKPAAGPTAAKTAKTPAKAKPVAKTEKVPVEPRVRRAADARTAAVVDAATGKKVDEVKLSAERFGLRADIGLLHLAVRVEQAGRRRGTASSKSRGEVVGSTAKLYRQKGTGRARAGSAKSPTRVGGGVAFGPKPRSFGLKINRKAFRKALTMALSDRAETGDIYVTRGLDLDEPSTSRVNELLVGLDIPVPVLVVTQDEPVIVKSVRNLWYAEHAEARLLTVEQVLRARALVVTEKAFTVLAGA